MKIHPLLIVLILFLLNGGVMGQDTLPDDPYTKGRSLIRDLNRIVNPAGLQEAYPVKIGGIEQWVFVRGQNKNNPVILFVHGGPASPMSSALWMYEKPMEEFFTFIHWDQRGAGKTFLTNDTNLVAPTIHIQNYVSDAIELAEYVKMKYRVQKMILMGHSWGTIVGMQAALQRPDLFYAYIGIGQVINTQLNEKLSFEYAVAQATKHRNDSALAELKTIAPYPGRTPITRERIIIARNWAQYYGGLSAYRNESTYFFRSARLSPEYTVSDIKGIDEGNLFTLGKILPEFLAVDFTKVTSFPIPVVMFMGRHDYTTPAQPTDAWMQKVKAPYKKAVWFEHSSHLLPFEEPGKMLVSLLQFVQPLTK